MRTIIAKSCIGVFAVAAGIVGMVSIASASEGLCSFTVAGYVQGVWCMMGPATSPCYLRIAVPVAEPTPEQVEIGVWCDGDMVKVCETLEDGLPVIVIGEDDGDNKSATHVAIWLEPSEAFPLEEATEGPKDR